MEKINPNEITLREFHDSLNGRTFKNYKDSLLVFGE